MAITKRQFNESISQSNLIDLAGHSFFRVGNEVTFQPKIGEIVERGGRILFPESYNLHEIVSVEQVSALAVKVEFKRQQDAADKDVV